MTRRRGRALAGAARLGLHLARRMLRHPLPAPTGLADRLAAIPPDGWPVERPVTIHWDDHQVPFVEAESDADCAVALGLVHAHLRLGQIELLRRVSQGRLAELVGEPGLAIDHALRILDPGRAVPAILAALAPATRAWLEGFAAGLTHYVRHVRELPHEFRLLGIGREPWTVIDLLRLARLAAADVNWIVWLRLLQLPETADWQQAWDRLTEGAALPVPSLAGAAPAGATTSADWLAALLAAFGRPGSNSVAVAAGRSAGGAAMIASDPHLGIWLPNLWLIAGYRSPSYHVVGLMIPGVPVVALGRNPWIAWGGTSLHAASSELYDVSAEPAAAFRVRQERISVRWRAPVTVTIRETALGPVLSDAPMLRPRGGRSIALRWVGHRPSDEIGAMLALNRARDWAGFNAAVEGFAIPGQNLLYADTAGHVGQVMAAHLPRRPPDSAAQLISTPDLARYWDSFATAADLPRQHDPAAGFVASANDRPAATPVPIGHIFSTADRVCRLRELLSGPAAVTRQALARLQCDVQLGAAVALRDLLLRRLDEIGGRQDGARRRRLLAALAEWRGDYAPDSRGALAFELLVYHLARGLIDGRRLAAYGALWQSGALIRADLSQVASPALAVALDRAVGRAAAAFRRYADWGDMHRLSLDHPLGLLPVLGRRYRFGRHRAGGSTDTVMKTAHGPAGRRHATRFGACARHISDLADLDANYFVLLGGQDGWLGSSTFLDQLPLWQRGEHVELPLRLDTVRARFRHRTLLRPPAPR
ncbi:MAG: penicillin acylase family protein [Dongiaceae bacterium]